MLDLETFALVVRNAPLISIDLIVRDGDQRVLLGRRTNRPAKDFWFVPGGRVCKDESLAMAFQRICQAELGLAATVESAAWHGAFEHFYDDSFVGSCSTHYVVLAFDMTIDPLLLQLPREQHSDYRWFAPAEALSASTVHGYTKNYLRPNTAAVPTTR